MRVYFDYNATTPLAHEVIDIVTRVNAEIFGKCRTALNDAGRPLLERAQAAGEVRADANIEDIIRMVGAIAMVPTEDPEQKQRLLELALDGLRYHPSDS